LKDVEPYEYTPYELKPPEITPTPAPEYKAPDPYMPGANATVKGQMEGLLSPGSSYIQSAQQRAKEALAPRGLLNTTMMGTAGERAAIEAALPIAQQDAGAFQEAGMLGYQGEIAGATSTQKHGQDVNLVGEQAKYSSLLSAQTAEQDAVTAAKKAKENEKLLVLGGDIDATAAAKKAVVDAEAAAKQATLDRELLEEKGRQDTAIETLRQESVTARQEAEIAFKDEIGKLELTTKEKDTASKLLADLGDSFSRQIGTVQSDPNLDAEAKTEIIAQLRAEYEQNVKSVADIYGIEIDWLTEPLAPEETFDGGSYRNGVSQDILDYMDSFPEDAAWKEYRRMKGLNPDWTVEEWSRQNRVNE